jgi:hypothetical protein
VRPALGAGSDVFCYFKHENEGQSTRLATRFAELLDGAAEREPSRPEISSDRSPPGSPDQAPRAS